VLGQAAPAHREVEQADIEPQAQPATLGMQRADQRHPRQHRQAPGHEADAPVAAEAPAQALDGGA
jgi:hypothetical protein